MHSGGRYPLVPSKPARDVIIVLLAWDLGNWMDATKELVKENIGSIIIYKILLFIKSLRVYVVVDDRWLLLMKVCNTSCHIRTLWGTFLSNSRQAPLPGHRSAFKHNSIMMCNSIPLIILLLLLKCVVIYQAKASFSNYIACIEVVCGCNQFFPTEGHCIKALHTL